jgi:hypothetical protein
MRWPAKATPTQKYVWPFRVRRPMLTDARGNFMRGPARHALRVGQLDIIGFSTTNITWQYTCIKFDNLEFKNINWFISCLITLNKILCSMINSDSMWQFGDWKTIQWSTIAEENDTWICSTSLSEERDSKLRWNFELSTDSLSAISRPWLQTAFGMPTPRL